MTDSSAETRRGVRQLLVELRQEKREVRIESRLQRWREGVIGGPLEVKDISDGLAITANGGREGLGSPQVSGFRDCWRQNAQEELL